MIRVGVIGAGGIAHKLHLPQVAETEGMRVTHIAGKEDWRLKILSERFDIPNWTLNYEELLAEESIDAIIVALPHPLHVPFGLKVLSANKHLLMQKPLCADMNEANQFVEAVEKTDKTVMCLPHFGAEIYSTRKLVESGVIGKPSGIHCRVSHGGPEVYYAEVRDYFEEKGDALWFFDASKASVGALFDMGVYAVAVLVAIMGSVKSVMGITTTIDKPTTLEDTATLILHFENGAVGTAETGWCDPAKSWELRVHGTAGKLVSPGRNGFGITRWEPGSYTREDTPSIPHDLDASPENRRNAHQHWAQCIREKRQPEMSNAKSARHVSEILLAGLKSSQTGQRVEILSKV